MFISLWFLGTKFVKFPTDKNVSFKCAKITVSVYEHKLVHMYDDTIPDILQRQAFTTSIFLSYMYNQTVAHNRCVTLFPQNNSRTEPEVHQQLKNEQSRASMREELYNAWKGVHK